MVEALRAYKEMGANVPGIRHLEITDLSLFWGGPIDLTDNWNNTSFLSGHRTGEAVDIKVRSNGNSIISGNTAQVLFNALAQTDFGLRIDVQGGDEYFHLFRANYGGVGIAAGEED